MGNIENAHIGPATRNFIHLNDGKIRVNGNFINGTEASSTLHGTYLQKGGLFEAAQSVYSYNGNPTVNTAANINIFHIDNGKFVMTGTPSAGNDSLLLNREIIVSETGQFIIDINRTVHCNTYTFNQHGGLILNANTTKLADYLQLETDYPTGVTVENAQGSFAMLKNSKLLIQHSTSIDGGLRNNHDPIDPLNKKKNVYFHRGVHRSEEVGNLPAMVSY